MIINSPHPSAVGTGKGEGLIAPSNFGRNRRKNINLQDALNYYSPLWIFRHSYGPAHGRRRCHGPSIFFVFLKGLFSRTLDNYAWKEGGKIKKTYISLAPCHIMVGSSVAHKILDEFMKENIFSLNTTYRGPT